MDWVMIVLILTAAPNFSQSQSHYLAGFTSEKLCKDAATEFENGLGNPFEGMKVEVRAVCSQRKNKGSKDE
jgi:hypothetical protein